MCGTDKSSISLEVNKVDRDHKFCTATGYSSRSNFLSLNVFPSTVPMTSNISKSLSFREISLKKKKYNV